MISLGLATCLHLHAVSAVPVQSSLPAERAGVRSSVYRCAIRQDGSLCASVRKNGRVELLNAELDPLHVIAEDLGAQCIDMRFSPDGSRLLLQTDRARLLLWHIEGAEVVGETELIEFSWEWHRPKSYDAEFSWAPDSTRFMTIDSLGHRRLYDRDGTLVRRLDAEGYERRGRGAAWHERSDALLLRDEAGIGV